VTSGQNAACLVIAAVIAAVPVQELLSDAPTAVIWAAFLALTVGIWFAIRAVIARKRSSNHSD
jgi:protein-S-isoprenylcysteine O-methyltransferase Ste14